MSKGPFRKRFRRCRWRLRRANRLQLFLSLFLILGAVAAHISIACYLANDEPGDGKLYSQLAVNLLEQKVYSIETEAPFNPTLIRLPGYPLFLAGVYSIFGERNDAAVRVIQALAHTLTCWIVALLAWNWAGNRRRRRAFWAAFLLAAVCPFTVIYTATILTETLTTFLLAAMALAATYGFKAGKRLPSTGWWFLTGILAGLAVLLRPDSGLFALGLGLTLVLVNLFTRGGFLSRCLNTFIKGFVFSIAFMLPLVPWTVRNEQVFKVFQPLAPAHAEMPGEFVAHGYFLWLRTWIDDQRYIEPMLWNLEDRPITIEQIPDYAFANDDERVRVAVLLEQYNHSQKPEDDKADESSPDDDSSADQSDAGDDGSADSDDPQDDGSADDDDAGQPDEQSFVMTPEIDAGFQQLAEERIRREPFSYYVLLPVERGAGMWFDTHSKYYPFDGELFPTKDLDREENQQVWLPVFIALVWVYTLLALTGAFLLLWRAEDGGRIWVVLAALLVFPRMILFATLENPEPRYFVELFIFTAILGGIALSRVGRRRQPEGGEVELSPSKTDNLLVPAI